MTTSTKTRLVKPTRTSRAFKPLKEVFNELEAGLPLIKAREEKILTAMTVLATYASYQAEKEKSGVDMDYDRFSTEIMAQAQDLTDQANRIVKTLKPLEPVVLTLQSITDSLRKTCKSLEKRIPVYSPPPAEPKTVLKAVEAPGLHVVKPLPDGGVQVDNFVFPDIDTASRFMHQWVR
jgi:hypothetical protein